MNLKTTVLTVLLLLTILSACTPKNSQPEMAVEAYLNAIVEADLEKITTVSCAEWEEDAWLELDSFQGVDVSLVDMQCTQSGSEGDIALVTCSGNFLTSYDGEAMEIDLSTRQYELVQQSGEWLVCGYR
ncbi:MAG: hypothetical protein IH585_06990 [Anaerolineaceae bacterium]|nr:hypothetical protein [Anaerolineaceae bacterium]